MGHTVHISAIKCESHKWRCASGDECVYKSWVCDNKDDCADGSDETDDACSEQILLHF